MTQVIASEEATVQVVAEEEQQDAIAVNQAAGIESNIAYQQVAKGDEVNPNRGTDEESYVQNNSYSKLVGETDAYRNKDIDKKVGVEDPEVIAKEVIEKNDNLTGVNHEQGLAKETALATAPAEEVEAETMRTMYRTQLGEYNNETFDHGLFDTIGTFGGLLLPERSSWTLDQVMFKTGFVGSEFSDIPTRVANIVNDSDRIGKLRGFVQKLHTPESRKAYFTDFVDALNDSSDNPIIKADILNKVFGEVGPSKGMLIAENALDFVAVGDVLELAYKGLTKAGKPINSIVRNEIAFRSGDKLHAGEKVAKMLTQSQKSPEVAAKLKVTIASAVDTQLNTTPSSVANFVSDAPKDLADEVVKSMQRQNEFIEEATAAMNREGVLSADEMQVFADKVARRYEKKEGVKSGSVVIKMVDDEVFEVTFKKQKTIQSGKNKGKVYWKSDSITESYHVSGTKAIDEADKLYEDFWRSNPNARMIDKLREAFVSIPERLLGEQSKLAGGFNRAINEAYKGVGAAGKGKIDEVLRVGEDEGVTYSFKQLTQVGVGPKSVKLSEKEAKAYIGHRNLLDQLFEFSNKRFGETLDIQGVKVVQWEGVNTPALTYETAEEAFKNYQRINKTGEGSNYIAIMDSRKLRDFAPTNGIIQMDNAAEMTLEWFQKAYNRGFTLAKNHSDTSFFQHKGGKTQWAFTKANEVRSPKGMRLLNKRVGYNPKQRKNGFFFIKHLKGAGLSGADKVKVQSTVAWADNAADAKAWIAASDNPDMYKVFADGELPEIDRMYQVNNANSGMYLGARSTEPLEFVGSDGSGDFVDMIEALGNYMNHTAKQYPVNAYRIGLEQRAIKTARAVTGDKSINNLNDLLKAAADPAISKKHARMLTDMFDQVKFLNNMPTAAEARSMQAYHDTANAIEASVVGKIPGFKGIPKILHRWGNERMDISNVLRGITFKHMLGMWSPDQILVQMSGGISAFAISPLSAIKATPQIIGFSMLDFVRNTGNKTLREAVEHMKKIGLGDYTEGYELWYKSGFYDSVMHSHADYTEMALFKNLPVDTMGVRKAIGSHTMFYRAGELANTRASFFTAFQEYKSMKGLKSIDPNDKEALAWIKTRAEQFRLNMTKANQSDLNKGLATVPLQFKQVIVKYFEKLLPKGLGGTNELTTPEKLRLMGIPTAAYGISSAPGGDYMMEKMYEFLGRDMQDVSPEESSLMRRGLLGWGFNYALDANVDMSTRLNLGTDFTKAVRDMMANSYNWSEMLGPVANVVRIYGNNWNLMLQSTQLYNEVEDVNFKPEAFQFAGSILFDAITDIPKIGRNGKKYWSYFMTDNPALYKNGQYIFESTELNTRTAVMAMLGMQLTEESDLYEWSNEIRRKQGSAGGGGQFLDDTAEILLRIANVNILGARGDEEAQTAVMVSKAIWYSFEPQERTKIFNKMNKLATERKLDPNNLYNKFMDSLIDDMDEGVQYYNEQFLKQTEMRQ